MPEGMFYIVSVFEFHSIATIGSNPEKKKTRQINLSVQEQPFT
jgi:hypothetical protein